MKRRANSRTQLLLESSPDNTVRFQCRGEYTKSGLPYVEFKYRDPLDVAVELMLDKTLIKSWDDFHTHHKVQLDEHGTRMYTPDLSSGELWSRSDFMYFGGTTRGSILWFLVFLDDTSLVQRGTTSAKPIMITLGNFPSEIRSKPVATLS
jgi:hypothetical protein